MIEVSFYMAFAAGVLSFLSPCVLPLLPSYVSFITGVSFEELTSQTDKARVRFLTITNSLAFIAGFSAVFISLGAASSVVGGWLFVYKDWIRIIGGILVIIFGLFISGILKMDFLMKERKIHIAGKPAGYFGSFFVGITFGAAWTPCIGPILGSILLYAGSKGSAVFGLKLLSVYSLGLAIPFFISAYAINGFLSYSKHITRYMRYIMFASGILLILFGVLLLTDRITVITRYLPDFGINF